MRLVTPFLVTAALLMCSAANALDFKGIVVGQRLDHQKLKAATGGDVIGDTTIAGCPAKIIVSTTHGVVDSIYIHFEARYFETVEAALREKFGKPTATDGQRLQNGFGARFANVIEQWNGTDGSNAYLESHNTAIESVLYLRSKKEVDKEEERVSKAKKDL